MVDHSEFRYGSAEFADEYMIARAGLYRARHGLYLGNDMHGRAMCSDNQSAVLLVGGARSNKGDHIIPWLVDGHYQDHIISMDWKSQNGAISQLQAAQGRYVININVRDSGDVPSHRINPLSYLRGDSPTLFPDAKLFAYNFMPLSGSSHSEYFEINGQRKLEVVAVGAARVDGVATLPRIADLMGQMGTLTDYWLAFEEKLASMSDPSIQQFVMELQSERESDNPNAGGAAGIKGEIAKAFACMSDNQLRAAVSPPYDFDFSDISKPGAPPHLVNIMESQEFAQTSGPVIKAIYTSALIYKRRAVGSSRRQVWLLDEVGNIGKWPIAVGLATYGAGYGIRPVFVVQSFAQLANLAPDADKIIPNSCGTQIYKGVRDYFEASRLSKMLGTKTIEHEDYHTNERASAESEQAVVQAMMGQVDPMQVGFEIAQRERNLQHQIKAPRQLMTADEVMSMKNGQALVFMPGILERPVMARIPHYWQRRDLAGRYLGDPFHSPPGMVELRTASGQRFAPVITEPAPDQVADWPQYRASGTWSFVKGYRPL